MGNFKKISSINNSFLFGLGCFYGVLGTRNNLVMKVRYKLSSRNC